MKGVLFSQGKGRCDASSNAENSGDETHHPQPHPRSFGGGAVCYGGGLVYLEPITPNPTPEAPGRLGGGGLFAMGDSVYMEPGAGCDPFGMLQPAEC